MPRKTRQNKLLTKDQALTALAVMILLFSAMMTWNLYSLLALAAAVLLAVAWYVRG